MEFGAFSNEEDQRNNSSTSSRGKLHFSLSSSQLKQQQQQNRSEQQQQHQFMSNLGQIYENRELGSLLGSKYDPEEDSTETKQEEKNNNLEAQVTGGERILRADAVIEKEHMFDKVVTPSDVGKLNRLVIPKQHAQKYFPLDSSTNEKGLLLNFEDRNGKEWRFRYSYWNSSQSYVMTKGWSRFVKDKKLDAGDIVSFQRGVGELGKDRLYIDWRRRPDHLPPRLYDHFYQHHNVHCHHQHGHYASVPWPKSILMRPQSAMPLFSGDHLHLSHPNNAYYSGPGGSSGGGVFNNRTNGDFVHTSSNTIDTSNSSYSNSNVVVTNPYSSASGSVFYMRGMGMTLWNQAGGSSDDGSGHGGEKMVYESVPVVQGNKVAVGKRLRLFGVNMDCAATSGEGDGTVDDQSHVVAATATMSSRFGGVATNNLTLLQPHQHQRQQVHPVPLSLLYNGEQVQGKFPSSNSSSMSFDLDI